MALKSSFEWFKNFLPKRSLPDPEDWHAWVLVAQVSDDWKGMIKAAMRSCSRFRQQIAQAKLWEMKIDRTLDRCGGLQAPTSPVQGGEDWKCGLCDKGFRSRRALATHATKVHDYKRWAKYYMAGSSCHACGSEFFSRARSVLHLTTSVKCAEVYRACVPPLPEEEVLRLDEAGAHDAQQLAQQGWHSTKALLPACRVHGPVFPPGASEEAQKLRQDWQNRFGAGHDDFSQLHGTFQGVADEETSEDVSADQSRFVAYVGNSEAGSIEGHAGVFQTGNLAALHSKLFIRYRCFIHFFSGYRREGDLQWQFENQWAGEDETILCLSIDLCLAKARSDLTSEANLRWWKERLLSGQICGIGGCPSCETWTAARHMERGPKPVRSGQLPWGNCNLTRAQWEQVCVGSRLLQFLVTMMVHAAVVGCCGFLEHPSYPLKNQLPKSQTQTCRVLWSGFSILFSPCV